MGTFLENKVVYQKYKSHQNSFSLRLILLTEKKSEKDWIDFWLLDDLENQNKAGTKDALDDLASMPSLPPLGNDFVFNSQVSISSSVPGDDA